MVHVVNHNVLQGYWKQLLHLASLLRHDYLVKVGLVQNSSVVVGVVKWALQIPVAFLLLAWFGFIVKRMVLMFFPAVAFQTGCL